MRLVLSIYLIVHVSHEPLMGLHVPLLFLLARSLDCTIRCLVGITHHFKTAIRGGLHVFDSPAVRSLHAMYPALRRLRPEVGQRLLVGRLLLHVLLKSLPLQLLGQHLALVLTLLQGIKARLHLRDKMPTLHIRQVRVGTHGRDPLAEPLHPHLLALHELHGVQLPLEVRVLLLQLSLLLSALSGQLRLLTKLLIGKLLLMPELLLAMRSLVDRVAVVTLRLEPELAPVTALLEVVEQVVALALLLGLLR